MSSLNSGSFQNALLDTIREPIFGIDNEFVIRIWNKAISKLTTLPAADVLGKPVSEVMAFNQKELTRDLSRKNSYSGFVHIGENEYRTLINPILNEDELVGYRGGLYAVNEGILDALPREYLVNVINSSPISTIVFNKDGSIMYSNNAYIEMWNLSKDDLQFVNHKYNLFLDKQLEKQGLMPFIRKAFEGESHKSPVFKYNFNTSALGRSGEKQYNWLLAHIFPIFNHSGDVEYVVLNFTDVTEQYKLERAVVESQEQLKLALEGGQLGTWDWKSTDGKVVYNERWAEMIGYTLDEVYEITWENLLHPDDKERTLRELNKMQSGETDTYGCEFRLRTKSGGWKWILGRGKRVQVPDSDVVRIAGTHFDINERKLAEERMRENEEKYKRLVDNAPIGIGIIADKKLVYINNELAKMGGIENKDEVIGKPAREFVPDDKRYQDFMERYKRVINERTNLPLYQTKMQTTNGAILDVEVVSIPIEYEEKPAMQILLNDITDRKKALDELSKSREMLHQLFENSPMGIVLLDDAFNVVNVNKGFERIFGYTTSELKGNSLINFIISPELVDEANMLNESALKGEINYFESFRYSKSGEKIPVLIYALPVIENGVNIGVYGIYIDIRQRLEAENELKTRNLELDNFVYKVSHDLRAPLASILGLINLTKLEASPTDKRHYIDLMEGQVQKLDHFIHDILSHSKNLKMSVSASLVDFNEIVEKCFNDLSYMKSTANIIKRVSIDEGEFYSDKWRIREIFRNLIGNAIKYQNPDIDDSFVEVKIETSIKGCEITVADNGIGISEENLPRVLEMFYRGTESSDGSGIGLYIVQKAVEKIKGTLTIESEEMKGTTIKISLPTLRNLVDAH